MELFRIKKDIPFMRHALVFNVLSLITFLLAIFFLISRGLHLSVEFTGGTLVEVRYEQAANLDSIRTSLRSAGFKDLLVQNFGSPQNVLIRVPLAGEGQEKQQSNKVMAALDAGAPGAVMQRVEYVGPQVGSELVEKGLLALALVVVGIVIYLAIRFEWRFSISAIIANLHDVVIILGCFAFFQWEFSLPVLAAVLAVLGTVALARFADRRVLAAAVVVLVLADATLMPTTSWIARENHWVQLLREGPAARTDIEQSSRTAVRSQWRCRCCFLVAKCCIILPSR